MVDFGQNFPTLQDFPFRLLPYVYSKSVSGWGLQLSCWGHPPQGSFMNNFWEKVKGNKKVLLNEKGFCKKVCPNGRGLRTNHQKVQNITKRS
jgi:hypothetical protein